MKNRVPIDDSISSAVKLAPAQPKIAEQLFQAYLKTLPPVNNAEQNKFEAMRLMEVKIMELEQIRDDLRKKLAEADVILQQNLNELQSLVTSFLPLGSEIEQRVTALAQFAFLQQQVIKQAADLKAGKYDVKFLSELKDCLEGKGKIAQMLDGFGSKIYTVFLDEQGITLESVEKALILERRRAGAGI